jgi:hypothetical protein
MKLYRLGGRIIVCVIAMSALIGILDMTEASAALPELALSVTPARGHVRAYQAPALVGAPGPGCYEDEGYGRYTPCDVGN